MTKKVSDDFRKEVGVYADIDTLLDSRLATLFEILPELVEDSMSRGYLTRDRDEFRGISQEDFKYIYEARTAKTLAHSIPTVVCRMVKEMCVKLLSNSLVDHRIGKTALFVNVHPYQLSEDEIKVLIASLAELMNGYIDIQILDIPPEELTPQYCDEHFAAMFMYDTSRWLDAHSKTEAFFKHRMKGVTVYAPMIYFGPKPTDEQKNLQTQTKYSPFRALEIQAAPFMIINFIATEMFCADVEQLIKKQQESPGEVV